MSKKNPNPHKRQYFLLSCLLLGVELVIAIYFKGSFVRFVLGDYLVVILLYCIVRAFSAFGVQKVAFGVLLFAYFVECLQWINILQVLGLQENSLTDWTLGSTFDWADMLAYTLGIFTVLVVEKWRGVLVVSRK